MRQTIWLPAFRSTEWRGGVVGESKIYLGRVFAEGPETRFTLPVPVGVKKLVVDPYQTVLDSSMMALVGWHALVRKLLGIRTLIVTCHLSRASQNILVGSQAFHTNRAARVQLTR